MAAAAAQGGTGAAAAAARLLARRRRLAPVTGSSGGVGRRPRHTRFNLCGQQQLALLFLSAVAPDTIALHTHRAALMAAFGRLGEGRVRSLAAAAAAATAARSANESESRSFVRSLLVGWLWPARTVLMAGWLAGTL